MTSKVDSHWLLCQCLLELIDSSLDNFNFDLVVSLSNTLLCPSELFVKVQQLDIFTNDLFNFVVIKLCDKR